MAALLHPPVLSDPPQELTDEQRRRLLATVTRAIERAAKAAGADARWSGRDLGDAGADGDAAVRDAGAGGDDAPTLTTTVEPVAHESAGAARPAARERVRPQSGGGAGGGGGGSGAVGASQAPSERFTTAGGDLVVRDGFPRRAVLRSAGATGAYVQTGAGPYVRSSSAGRAQAWGRLLHGGRGYAVVRGVADEPDAEPPFYAVPLAEPLDAGAVGPLDAAGDDGVLTVGGEGARLVSTTDTTTVMVATRDDYELYGRGSDADGSWSYDDVQRALAALAPAQATIGAEEARAVADALLGSQAAAPETVERVDVSLLVAMDRTMFAAVPWERRVEILAALAAELAGADEPAGSGAGGADADSAYADDADADGRATSGERERAAIAELLHASQSVDELESAFALLRSSGGYGRLLGRLDDRSWELLELLGSFRAVAAPSWRSLAAALADTRVGRLAELAGTDSPAHDGGAGAPAPLEQVAPAAGRRAALVLAGLDYADEVGTPADARGSGEHVSGAVRARVRVALAAQIAAAFAESVAPAPGAPGAAAPASAPHADATAPDTPAPPPRGDADAPAPAGRPADDPR